MGAQAFPSAFLGGRKLLLSAAYHCRLTACSLQSWVVLASLPAGLDGNMEPSSHAMLTQEFKPFFFLLPRLYCEYECTGGLLKRFWD